MLRGGMYGIQSTTPEARLFPFDSGDSFLRACGFRSGLSIQADVFMCAVGWVLIFIPWSDALMFLLFTNQH